MRLYIGRINIILNDFCIVNSQIQEMGIFQQNLLELERSQQVIKKQLRVFSLFLLPSGTKSTNFI